MKITWNETWGTSAVVSTTPKQSSSPSNGRGTPFWKRCLDITIVALAAPAWLPVMALSALAIKLVSHGPVLFRQERIGFGGEKFQCLKFRTMRAGCATNGHEKHFAELIQSNQPMIKLDGHDQRLIPGAWILRSTGLDELPQLLNILRGEMSLVGPRPCTPREFEAYSPEQRARTNSLPGLTGLWQVSGKNHTTFRQMIELDIRYTKTLSVGQDLSIMIRTPLVLINQLTESFIFRQNKSTPPTGQASASTNSRSA